MFYCNYVRLLLLLRYNHAGRRIGRKSIFNTCLYLTPVPVTPSEFQNDDRASGNGKDNMDLYSA